METAGPPARAPTVRTSTGSAARFPALPRPRFSSPRPSFLRTRGSRRLLRNLRGPSAPGLPPPPHARGPRLHHPRARALGPGDSGGSHARPSATARRRFGRLAPAQDSLGRTTAAASSTHAAPTRRTRASRRRRHADAPRPPDSACPRASRTSLTHVRTHARTLTLTHVSHARATPRPLTHGRTHAPWPSRASVTHALPRTRPHATPSRMRTHARPRAHALAHASQALLSRTPLTRTPLTNACHTHALTLPHTGLPRTHPRTRPHARPSCTRPPTPAWA